MRKILITGAEGSVGKRLKQDLIARSYDVHGVDIDTLDIVQYEPTLAYFTFLQPDLVVHCAAMTNVDRCAEQPNTALLVNGIGTQNVALACQKIGAALCYISTNEVFDGQR